jgi:hypothetical protein
VEETTTGANLRDSQVLPDDEASLYSLYRNKSLMVPSQRPLLTLSPDRQRVVM